MSLASIFENINVVFNCFCPAQDSRAKAKKVKDMDRQIQRINGRYDIHILKVAQDFHIKNLYPPTDRVENWSVFIVGNDKTYIHVSLGDFTFPDSENLLNNRGANVMPNELNEFFDPIWTQTLEGCQLQFYMSVQQRLFFVNTYPFINDNKEVIGAIMFVRPFTSERVQAIDDGDDYPRVRVSIDRVRPSTDIKR